MTDEVITEVTGSNPLITDNCFNKLKTFDNLRSKIMIMLL